MDNLQKLIFLEKDARAFGFDWPNIEMIIKQAISECEEITDVIKNQESKERLQEEIGDLLHTAISLCVFAKFDVIETINNVNRKFNNRIQILKNLTKKQGLPNLKGQPISLQLDLWHQVKNIEKNQ
jgi:uncharacterized protein YabN with tetrapyrrole methylase and pyrophosphatase domain